MTHRVLTSEEITKHLRAEPVKVKPWPDDIGLIALAKAVKAGEHSVMINGKRFNIRYKTKFKDGAIYISPDSTAFVPCGYISRKRLSDALALEQVGLDVN